MKLTIKIDSNNTSFDDGFGGRNEAARILRELNWSASDDVFNLYDSNGNKVGTFFFEESESDGE